MAELDRIRWHCRRGMLELDLVLARFNAAHLARLTPAQLHAFEALLVLPDGTLLDLVLNSGAASDLPDPADEVLALMRAA